MRTGKEKQQGDSLIAQAFICMRSVTIMVVKVYLK